MSFAGIDDDYRAARLAGKSGEDARQLDTGRAAGNHRGMKIYTRTGDDGSTGLFGGGRVRKSDPRIECYGTIDELNAAIGLATAAVEADAGSPAAYEMRDSLRQVQHELFNIGSHL